MYSQYFSIQTYSLQKWRISIIMMGSGHPMLLFAQVSHNTDERKHICYIPLHWKWLNKDSVYSMLPSRSLGKTWHYNPIVTEGKTHSAWPVHLQNHSTSDDIIKGWNDLLPMEKVCQYVQQVHSAFALHLAVIFGWLWHLWSKSYASIKSFGDSHKFSLRLNLFSVGEQDINLHIPLILITDVTFHQYSKYQIIFVHIVFWLRQRKDIKRKRERKKEYM